MQLGHLVLQVLLLKFHMILKVGSQVEVINVTSVNNPTGVANSGFNGTFTVTGISSKTV
jgi:hypothetical protein